MLMRCREPSFVNAHDAVPSAFDPGVPSEGARDDAHIHGRGERTQVVKMGCFEQLSTAVLTDDRTHSFDAAQASPKRAALVGRREKDGSALLRLLGAMRVIERRSENNPPQAMGHKIDRLPRMRGGDLPEIGRQHPGMLFNRPPSAGIPPKMRAVPQALKRARDPFHTPRTADEAVDADKRPFLSLQRGKTNAK